MLTAVNHGTEHNSAPPGHRHELTVGDFACLVTVHRINQQAGILHQVPASSTVNHELHGYMLNQSQAILELLERFGLADANTVIVPVVDNQDEGDDRPLLPGGTDGTPYRPTIQLFPSLVGSLLWIARYARPDTVFTVHRVTRRAHAPTESDWWNAKRIMRYLNGTIDVQLGLVIDSDVKHSAKVRLEGYSDADFAADRNDRKSVSGGVLCVDGLVVGWL
ncbi:unnamed protein product [Phytophthora fragariaefolia]|uniref:Unnamed protein product n=1 Tax=Phytophthora fragariaefolia TaxID=1490495 RepID=A0A9W7CWB0_9STRA|nr:unnamed protein product [Phytophthora fragariaefolia]